mmetsp:Transcript_22563/g.40381  ORF Transcript_22563/g.40381 Transcript_22563/m.40381 type:complete len:90 (-) Transcript_22563:163-432(-)
MLYNCIGSLLLRPSRWKKHQLQLQQSLEKIPSQMLMKFHYKFHLDSCNCMCNLSCCSVLRHSYSHAYNNSYHSAPGNKYNVHYFDCKPL